MKYKGWIPVASGYLSFTNIKGQVIAGRCKKPPKITYGSLELCELTIESVRTLIDRPLGPLRSMFGTADEKYVFECRAKRERIASDEQMVGVVIAYPRAASADVKKLKLQTHDNIGPGIYKSALCWVIGFQLTRDGCISLDWGDLAKGGVSQIVDIQEGSDEQSAEMVLTFETFSFLKDLIHNHKFHSADDDSIVVPVMVNGEDDEIWRDETARNLHRAIVSSLRNNPGHLELTNAIGKTCYLKAFLSISNTEFCSSLNKSLGNLEDSIHARLQGHGFASSTKDVVKNTWITIVLACVATAMTLLQLLQIPCIKGLTPNETCTRLFSLPVSALNLADIMLSNWTTFFYGTFAMLCGIGYLASRRPIIELYSHRTGSESLDWHLMRFFYGLALTNGKYIALTWLTILTASILGLFGFMMFSLLSH